MQNDMVFDDFLPVMKSFGLHPKLNNLISNIKRILWFIYFTFMTVSLSTATGRSLNYNQFVQGIESVATVLQVIHAKSNPEKTFAAKILGEHQNFCVNYK